MQIKSPVIDLAYYLEGQLDNELKVDEGICVFTLPTKPDLAISIHEYQGSSYAEFDPVNWRGIQISVRSKSRQEAYSLSSKCSQLLHKKDSVIDLTNILDIKSRTSPTEIDLDEHGRHRYVFSIGCLYNYEI